METTANQYSTPDRGIITVTDDVTSFLQEHTIDTGICVVYCPHTTAGIVINEDESGLRQDIVERYDDLFPPGDGYHHNRHGDTNADSHLKAIAFGPAKTIPVQNGEPVLGTWQDIMLVETDGPRTRTVVVTVIEG